MGTVMKDQIMLHPDLLRYEATRYLDEFLSFIEFKENTAQ